MLRAMIIKVAVRTAVLAYPLEVMFSASRATGNPESDESDACATMTVRPL